MTLWPALFNDLYAARMLVEAQPSSLVSKMVLLVGTVTLLLLLETTGAAVTVRAVARVEKRAESFIVIAGVCEEKRKDRTT